MGSGKTTVGRMLARALGWDFVDLDREISRRSDRANPEIFATSGEDHFRDLEHRALLTTLDGERKRVIACGGGRAVDLGRVEIPVAPPYPVVVGVGLDLAGIVSGELEPGVAAILTDSNVGPLHAPKVGRALDDAGWRVAEVLEIPAGEPSKGLAAYAEVAGALARAGLTRDGTLFALGGGVVGDLGGFVAATFMRGIGFVALPTSLLAMVDSSVGGKVGVDLPEGKNLLGSFLRPRLVAADLDWLQTLPQRELC